MAIRNPVLEALSINDLQVDPHVQRSWDENWSKTLAKAFDEEKLGVFRVSRRDASRGGGDFIVDGQHRWHACKDQGWDEDESYVQCLVYEGLTQAEEAALYVAFNVESRRPNAIDTYRLENVAGMPEAVEIQKVVDKHGLVVAFGGAANYVSAVSALRWVYRLGGSELLDRTFTVVEKAWGPRDRWARDGNLLKGLAHVLKKAGHLDQSSLEEKLGKSGRAGQLLGNARTLRSATGRSLWLETAHQIVTVYNHSRRSHKVAL